MARHKVALAAGSLFPILLGAAFAVRGLHAAPRPGTWLPCVLLATAAVTALFIALLAAVVAGVANGQ
jgi:tellurite resistance protein TehA-like permease